MNTDNSNANFTQWMDQVDRLLMAMTGFTSSDFADICYRDLYDSGASSLDAAEECLENEGCPLI